MKNQYQKLAFILAILVATTLAIFLWPKSVKADSSELTIISREQWEADDNFLLNSNSETIWPINYQKPVKFVIHHTVGSDGSVDPAGITRAIYYYHAQILGWGDIGYNYLIDANGNIYEGRKGGDGAIGAHAYRDGGCNVARFGGANEGIDFNAGTIGIALLGNYEDNQPTAAAIASLNNLIAHKSVNFGIDPQAVGTFQDMIDLPNVVGHQDVDCTLCPGKNLASQLPVIRETAYAQSLVISDTGASFVPVVGAELAGQSATELSLKPGETTTIWADYKNIGNFTWRKYYDDTVYLASADYGETSLLNLAALAENRVDLETGNVEPNGTGRVAFTIKAPKDKLSVSETFFLVYGDTEVPGTRFSIKVEVVGLDYAAELSSQNILPATFVSAKIRTTFRFVNKGIKTWTNDNTYLNIYDLNLKPSLYRDATWPAEDGHIALTEKTVTSGATGTFVFDLKSPKTPGLYQQIFKLLNDEQEIINSEVNFITRVDSHYQAQLIEQNIPPAISSVWRPKAVIKFKNTGVAIWDQNLIFSVYDLGQQESKFKDKTWTNSSGQFRLKQKTVKPGAIGTFEFYYNNKKPGIYKQIFKLSLSNKDVVIQGGSFDLITRVD